MDIFGKLFFDLPQCFKMCSSRVMSDIFNLKYFGFPQDWQNGKRELVLNQMYTTQRSYLIQCSIQ